MLVFSRVMFCYVVDLLTRPYLYSVNRRIILQLLIVKWLLILVDIPIWFYICHLLLSKRLRIARPKATFCRLKGGLCNAPDYQGVMKRRLGGLWWADCHVADNWYLSGGNDGDIAFFQYFCILEYMMLGCRRGLLLLLVGGGGVADLPGRGIGLAWML